MVGISVEVEREMRIRSRLLNIFNERREDFPTLKAYNDYLEMVEDYIFNLANQVDVEETEAKIEDYRRKNADHIAQRKAIETGALFSETHNPPPPEDVKATVAAAAEASAGPSTKPSADSAFEQDNAGVLSYLLATTSASGNQSGGVHAVYANCIKLAQRRAKEESIASMFF